MDASSGSEKVETPTAQHNTVESDVLIVDMPDRSEKPRRVAASRKVVGSRVVGEAKRI